MQSILAYFLIDKDRNINEGMELVEKALQLILIILIICIQKVGDYISKVNIRKH